MLLDQSQGRDFRGAVCAVLAQDCGLQQKIHQSFSARLALVWDLAPYLLSKYARWLATSMNTQGHARTHKHSPNFAPQSTPLGVALLKQNHGKV